MIDKVISLSSSEPQQVSTHSNKEAEDKMQVDSCQNEVNLNETNNQKTISTPSNNLEVKDQGNKIESKINQAENLDISNNTKITNNEKSEKNKSPIKLAEVSSALI